MAAVAPSFNMLWAVTCNCPCWPKPRWCSGRRRQHELLTTNGKNMGFSDQLWGLNLPKWEDIEMVDPLGCYFGFIQALLHWSKQMQKEYVHPCSQAVRLAFVTWRRRLPGPPHQRCCSDLIWIWRGINGEHWFRFQKLSFELSRSHGHYSYKMLQMLKRLGLN